MRLIVAGLEALVGGTDQMGLTAGPSKLEEGLVFLLTAPKGERIKPGMAIQGLSVPTHTPRF